MAALQTEFVRVADDAERAAELLKLVRGREGRTLVFANSACRRDGAEMWPRHSRERESSLPSGGGRAAPRERRLLTAAQL